MTKEKGLTSDFTPEQVERFQKVKDFWDKLPSCQGGTEETHWSVLEGLRTEVKMLLDEELVDLNLLESLTAQAAIRLSGKRYF